MQSKEPRSARSRGRISNRISIEQRPAIVAQKSRIGDWEGDTIIGKGYQGIVTTHIERKTKYTVLTKSNTKHAKPVRKNIAQGLTPYRSQIHTINYDNGLEFSEHQNIVQNLSANIYYAHPYSSWERSLNENTNGFIRQYLPKSQPLNNVTQKELNDIMDQFNHKPRKTLGFKTPYELFFKKNTLLTVALQT
jgi:transposase, IS30 family